MWVHNVLGFQLLKMFKKPKPSWAAKMVCSEIFGLYACTLPSTLDYLTSKDHWKWKKWTVTVLSLYKISVNSITQASGPRCIEVKLELYINCQKNNSVKKKQAPWNFLPPQPAVGIQEGPGCHWSHLGLHFDFFRIDAWEEKKGRSSMTDINDVQPLRSTGSTCPSRPAARDTTATGQGQKEKSGIEAWRRFALWQVQNLLSSCWYRGIGPVGRFLFPTRRACPIAGYWPGLCGARVRDSIKRAHTENKSSVLL